MQTCRWRGHGTRALSVDSLVALFIAHRIVPINIGGQGHMANLLQHLGNGIITAKLENK